MTRAKLTYPFVAFALLFSAISDPALAASATARASATVVAPPLRIASATDLRFGALAARGGAGTVTVSPSGRRVATGGVALLGNANFGAATFRITGQANADFTITLPDSIEVTHDSGRSIPGVTSLIAVDLVSLSETVGAETEVGRLDAAGKDVVRVGGTLIVPATARTGSYRGVVTLSIEYQ